MLVLPVALLLSACQTTDDVAAVAGVSNAMAAVGANERAGRPDRSGGAPLLGNTRGGPSTVIEGSGRFVGAPSSGTGRGAVDAGPDGITLNLVNVPAPQAAKTILGDILAVKYTIDPGIEGKITIQTPKPVARSAVIDLFQSALRSNNAAIVDADGLYRIVPIDQATVGASMKVEGNDGSSEQIGSGLQVVQLKYVSASEMRRVLEPIAPRGGIVRTDDARNLITLSGNRTDIGAMTEAIAKRLS